ncbi:hypothetical protein OAQ99_03755 [Candidatus Kapabacteria bacterium]|nr:hypothetical protein [Candidatus Kapabacteria bacterium]
MLKNFHILFIITILTNISYSKKCFDYQLTDGSERLLAYGMDTTYHWWAVTEPFEDFKRLIVDGEELSTVRNLTTPVFSQDGNRWASFMKDNSGWILVDQDSSWRINTTKPGTIVYSADSKVMAYSYFQGETLEKIIIDNQEVQSFDRSSDIFLSQDGSSYAFVQDRGGLITLLIDGRASGVYDQITPFGFLNDGSFLWAAGISGNWHVFRNFEEYSEMYNYVDYGQINPDGSLAAYAARLTSNQYVAVLIDDELSSPLETTRLDFISNLKLHPFEPILSYEANFNDNYNVYMNTVPYEAGRINSPPQFTHDGEEMFFVGCRIDCFASVNGKKYSLQAVDLENRVLAVKPKSETFAFTTSSSLVVRDMTKKELWSGMMANETINPRYNRVDDRYETLGVINNRLYLLTCRDKE